MPNLEIHPDAVAELEATISWYEQQKKGLGKLFLDELNRSLEIIVSAPERWKIYIGRTRCYVMQGFPYAVVYFLNQDKVQIFAISHLRRRPEYWRSRTMKT